MLSYLRRLLVVYLSVKVMRRPLLMNKRQRSALFVCTKAHKKEVRSEDERRMSEGRAKVERRLSEGRVVAKKLTKPEKGLLDN